MVEKRTYIAYNGKEFNDREECLEYERIKSHDTFKFFNDEYEEIDYIDDAGFLLIHTEDELKSFHLYCEEYNLRDKGVEGVGLYIWNNSAWAWENYDEYVQSIIAAGEKMRASTEEE